MSKTIKKYALKSKIYGKKLMIKMFKIFFLTCREISMVHFFDYTHIYDILYNIITIDIHV